ncbi:hypothetical protein GCM10028771_29680 [Nocardioides marmoraquaticus]
MDRGHQVEVGSRPDATVLVVCSANVCRSPSMQLRLSDNLDRAAPGVAWRVTSAGVDARPGQAMCRHAAKAAGRLPGGNDFVAAHRSQALTQHLVAEAGLILLASQDERAAVAVLSPEARRRTFTLCEAAMMMARGLPADGSALPIATSAADLLPTVVDLLHEQRGTLSISTGPAHFSRRSWGRTRRAQLDIGDVHQGQERRHKPVLDTIGSASRDLADGVARLRVLSHHDVRSSTAQDAQGGSLPR